MYAFWDSRRLKKAGDFHVSCDGMAVNRVTSVNYLGVRLDESLSFKAQFQTILSQGRLFTDYLQVKVEESHGSVLLVNFLVTVTSPSLGSQYQYA